MTKHHSYIRGLCLLVVIAVFLMGCAEQSSNLVGPDLEDIDFTASKKGDNNGKGGDKGKGGGGNGDDDPTDGGPTGCTIEFSATLAELLDGGITGDGQGSYVHSNKKKIYAVTGDRGGFRFDTNTTGKDKAGRTVNLDFSGFPEGVTLPFSDFVTTHIDMRFVLALGGFNMCSLANGESGEVAMEVNLYGEAEAYHLVYGHQAGHLGEPDPSGTEYGEKVTITRVDADTWILEGTTAELVPDYGLWVNPPSVGGPFMMPFHLTLVRQ